MANVNSTQTSFKIRLDLYDKLRFQAVKENRSQGEILNEALEDYLQKVENQTTFDEKLWLKNYWKNRYDSSEKDTGISFSQ